VDQETGRASPKQEIMTIVHHIERFWKQLSALAVWSK